VVWGAGFASRTTSLVILGVEFMAYKKQPKEWKVGQDTVVQTRKRVLEIFIESEDFKHDVRLYINGDFRSDKECIEYAQRIANKLNK
jgi:hypothetical protein